VQAVRGVACLLVVLAHLWALEAEFGTQTPGFNHVRSFGFAGVDLFFVVSGFIITATNRRHLGRPAAVPGYLARRLWRIYPPYWAAAGVAFAYYCAAGGWDRAVTPEIAGGEWAWWLALVPVESGNQLVGQAWTLSFEVMFYVAFGLLMLAPPRALAAGLAGWAAVVLAAAAWPVPARPLATLPVSPFVLEFLGGCGVAWLAGRGERRGWRVAAALGIAWAAAGVWLTATPAPEPYADAMHSQRLRVLVFGPAALLLVYAAVAAEGRWNVSAGLLAVGDASYSLYLIHPTALAVGKWAGVLVPHTRLGHTLWLLGTLAGVVAAGLLFYRWVEQPLLNVVKRKKPAAPAVTPEPLRRAA
jgi:peptidoglycan/LPS O-acetylase OafA/YrhL